MVFRNQYMSVAVTQPEYVLDEGRRGKVSLEDEMDSSLDKAVSLYSEVSKLLTSKLYATIHTVKTLSRSHRLLHLLRYLICTG